MSTYTPELVSPFLIAKRAMDYWHKHGQFPFDLPGYDPSTGLVKVPHKRKPHQCTGTQEHTSTGTPSHTAPSAVTCLLLKDNTESPRTPYDMLPIVQAEREDRESLGITAKDYGVKWHSAYREVIGPSPECMPGDHATAKAHWQRIVAALQRNEGDDGGNGWTPAENHRLRLLERKWRKRAEGHDPRFEVVGTYRGQVTAEDRARVEDQRILESVRERVTCQDDREK